MFVIDKSASHIPVVTTEAIGYIFLLRRDDKERKSSETGLAEFPDKMFENEQATFKSHT